LNVLSNRYHIDLIQKKPGTSINKATRLSLWTRGFPPPPYDGLGFFWYRFNIMLIRVNSLKTLLHSIVLSVDGAQRKEWISW